MRPLFIFLSLCLLVLLYSCTSTKNTAGTRWYHSFNTRYNVYFNGDQAYRETMKSQQESYTENYTEKILMFPVSALPKDKQDVGGPFDKAIEKGVKAIKTHSIQTKPEKKAGKQNDLKYKEFMSRTEYNPFLHNAWMLIAKSQFHNGDFLQAASTFSYISRLYETQPEIGLAAKIWQARCYSELEWFYEAEDILSKVNNNQLPKKLTDWFSTVYADYLIKQKQYESAIPYLRLAVKSEKNKLQRTREKYLLGQLYAETRQKDMAYKTFGEVSGAHPPYILELSAKIRQTEVYLGGDIQKMTSRLKKMTKGFKNKDYLDQIYYALGNIYMTIPDSAKAIENYESGVEKSIRNGLDKALNQIQLGDIYFNRRKYLKAQPNYSEALSQLKKEDAAYPRVSKRSEVLDELVIHVEAVELQDSLQRLSKMSEEERMAVINKIIEDLIKKEKEEQEKQERNEYLAKQEEFQAQQQSMRPDLPAKTVMAPTSEENSFYFYNPQVVSVGKNTFQQKWGRRKLEDDWRRRNKSNPLSDTLAENESVTEQETLVSDSTENIGEENLAGTLPDSVSTASTDPHDPQFYLQQIPVTPEDLAASDLIIMDGLFNMGLIYKDLLEDRDLALETFEILNTRFPENENKLEAYYHIYMIHWREGNMDMANLFKAKIRNEFPESDYAAAMADPDYEYNLKMMNIVQDSLYQVTYDSYLEGKTFEIRENYALVSTKYNQSKLMPKFMFVNALSFVQTNETDTFKVLLKELIDKYPSEDVSVLASDIMKGFQRGLLLSSSGDNMLANGSLFNMRFGGEDEDLLADSALMFSMEQHTPHELLLVYPKGSINENLLLYTVAAFNFGNFMVHDFDLEKTEIKEIGLLQIKGFNNQEEVLQYVRMIHQPAGYANDLKQEILIIPVSVANYEIMMKGKSLGEYMDFFEEYFSEGNENLIAKWRLKQIEEMKALSDETNMNVISVDSTLLDSSVDSLEMTEPNLAPVALPTVRTNQTDSIESVVQEETLSDVYHDVSDKIENATHTWNEIAEDPIRGIFKLFKRKKSSNAIDDYAKQQEKEEKERQKLLKKEQKEKEKIAGELAAKEEKEKEKQLKKQQKEDEDLLKAQKQKEKDLLKLRATEKKQKEAEKKRLAQEKEKAKKENLKRKQEEQKAKNKQRELERKRKEKERKEVQQAKQKERAQRKKK